MKLLSQPGGSAVARPASNIMLAILYSAINRCAIAIIAPGLADPVERWAAGRSGLFVLDRLAWPGSEWSGEPGGICGNGLWNWNIGRIGLVPARQTPGGVQSRARRNGPARSAARRAGGARPGGGSTSALESGGWNAAAWIELVAG